MNSIDVVYFYEHASRELDVACAVTAILERDHAVSIRIVHWPVGFADVEDRIRPRLVILPFCYTEDSFTLALATWRKSIYFNVAWEQLFYSGNLKAKTPRGEFATQHIIHHAWSDSYANYLKECGVPGNHIFINGQPAYTLYTEPYRRFFLSRDELGKKYNLDPSRKWVFFPENYNWAFYTQATISQFITGGQTLDEVRRMRDFCERSLQATMMWCAEAVGGSDVEIIVRPRPAVTSEAFISAISSSLPRLPDHLHVIQAESVRDWILACDLVVSSYSTSLIEAAVAKKPIFILAPLSFPDSMHVGWHDLVLHIQTKEDFLRICSARSGPDQDDRLEQWARNTLMHHGDSIQRLADQISQILNGEVLPPKSPSWKVAIPDWRFRYMLGFRKPYRIIKKRLSRSKSSVLPEEYKKDFKSETEIRQQINRWSELLSSSLN